MTTTTDFEVRDRETNDRLTVTDVESALAERQAAFLPTVAPEVRHRPDVDPVPLYHDGRPLEHVRTPRRSGHQVPAYGYGRLVGQSTLTPNRAAVRDVRLHQEVGYEHLRQHAQDLEDVPFWVRERQAERAAVLRVSEGYAAKRESRLQLYRQNLQAILDGGAPLPAEHPARELAPAKLDADAARRRRALAAAAHRTRQATGPPHWALSAPLSKAERNTKVRQVRAAFKRLGGDLEPGRPSWRDYAGIIAGAAIGLAGFAALLIGRVVL